MKSFGDCVPGNYKYPYDPRCRGWYNSTKAVEYIKVVKPYIFFAA